MSPYAYLPMLTHLVCHHTLTYQFDCYLTVEQDIGDRARRAKMLYIAVQQLVLERGAVSALSGGYGGVLPREAVVRAWVEHPLGSDASHASHAWRGAREPRQSAPLSVVAGERDVVVVASTTDDPFHFWLPPAEEDGSGTIGDAELVIEVAFVHPGSGRLVACGSTRVPLLAVEHLALDARGARFATRASTPRIQSAAAADAEGDAVKLTLELEPAGGSASGSASGSAPRGVCGTMAIAATLAPIRGRTSRSTPRGARAGSALAQRDGLLGRTMTSERGEYGTPAVRSARGGQTPQARRHQQRVAQQAAAASLLAKRPTPRSGARREGGAKKRTAFTPSPGEKRRMPRPGRSAHGGSKRSQTVAASGGRAGRSRRGEVSTRGAAFSFSPQVMLRDDGSVVDASQQVPPRPPPPSPPKPPAQKTMPLAVAAGGASAPPPPPLGAAPQRGSLPIDDERSGDSMPPPSAAAVAAAAAADAAMAEHPQSLDPDGSSALQSIVNLDEGAEKWLSDLIATGVVARKHARGGLLSKPSGPSQRILSLVPADGAASKSLRATLEGAKVAGLASVVVTVDQKWSVVVGKAQVKHVGMWQTKAKNIARLPEITSVALGKDEGFGKAHSEFTHEDHCFSICTKKRTFDLEMPHASDREDLVKALMKLVRCVQGGAVLGVHVSTAHLTHL